MRYRLVGLVLLLASVVAGAADLPPQQFAKLGALKLESGAVIHDCALGYRTIGTLNAARSNAILMPTWHTGTSEDLVAMVSAKGMLDPANWFVIVVDTIGNGVSCSPSNSKTQHGAAFPAFTVRDMVEAEYRLVTEQLGLRHLHAVVGFSLGGVQTFQWMVSHPGFMEVAVPVDGSPRLSSYDKLLWRTFELASVSDPAYASGNYNERPRTPLAWMLLDMHMTSPDYRVAHTPAAESDKYFKARLDDPDVPDANDSLWQLRAMLAHDVGDKAPSQVKARVHVIHAAQDHVMNAKPALDFAQQIHAGTTVLQSNCGHFAAITCELETVRTAIKAALK